jgi:hypothetical protein
MPDQHRLNPGEDPMKRAATNGIRFWTPAGFANATRTGMMALAALLAGAVWAAQPSLEAGSWKLTVASTTNGKADPAQNTEDCLRAEQLEDLGAYFAPDLDGAKAKCSRARRPSSDPEQLVHRMRWTGSGFSSEVDA